MTWDACQRDLQPRFHSLFDVVRHDPAGLAAHLLRNLWEHARLDAVRQLGPAVAMTAAAGAALGVLDRKLSRVWPLVLAGVVAYLAVVPAPHGERYSLMILPIYVMLAGMAFGSRLFALPMGPRGRVWFKPFFIVVPLSVSLIASVRLQAEVLGRLPREVLVCGRVLREMKRPGDGVIARKPHLAYVSQVESIPFPFATALPELATYARQYRARWLYISYPEVESRPDYYPLLDTTGVIAGLTPRCVTTRPAAVLYEIGPEFSRDAQWIEDPQLMNLRVARARLLLVPDDVQAMWLEAAMEVLKGQWARSRPTLERAAAIDGRSREALAAVSARDSVGAVALLNQLLSTIAPGRSPAPREGSPSP